LKKEKVTKTYKKTKKETWEELSAKHKMRKQITRRHVAGRETRAMTAFALNPLD